MVTEKKHYTGLKSLKPIICDQETNKEKAESYADIQNGIYLDDSLSIEEKVLGAAYAKGRKLALDPTNFPNRWNHILELRSRQDYSTVISECENLLELNCYSTSGDLVELLETLEEAQDNNGNHLRALGVRKVIDDLESIVPVVRKKGSNMFKPLELVYNALEERLGDQYKS